MTQLYMAMTQLYMVMTWLPLVVTRSNPRQRPENLIIQLTDLTTVLTSKTMVATRLSMRLTP